MIIQASRHWIAAFVVLFALLVLQPGISVLAEDGPTAADLKAGYCVNIIQGRDAQFQLCQRVTSDSPELEKAKEATCREDRNNVQRLKDYLAARGYLPGGRDFTPIFLAGSRGNADLKDCMDFVDHSTPESRACMNSCTMKMIQSKDQSKASKDFLACSDACSSPAACLRVRSCEDLSFLPF